MPAERCRYSRVASLDAGSKLVKEDSEIPKTKSHRPKLNTNFDIFIVAFYLFSREAAAADS